MTSRETGLTGKRSIEVSSEGVGEVQKNFTMEEVLRRVWWYAVGGQE